MFSGHPEGLGALPQPAEEARPTPHSAQGSSPLIPVVSWPQSCQPCFSKKFLNTFVVARHFVLNFNQIHIFCTFLSVLYFQDYLRWEGFKPESRLQTLPLHPWIGQGQTRGTQTALLHQVDLLFISFWPRRFLSCQTPDLHHITQGLSLWCTDSLDVAHGLQDTRVQQLWHGQFLTRDWTCHLCTTRQIFNPWTTREVPIRLILTFNPQKSNFPPYNIVAWWVMPCLPQLTLVTPTISWVTLEKPWPWWSLLSKVSLDQENAL